jgi:hypothetical protein
VKSDDLPNRDYCVAKVAIATLDSALGAFPGRFGANPRVLTDHHWLEPLSSHAPCQTLYRSSGGRWPSVIGSAFFLLAGSTGTKAGTW